MISSFQQRYLEEAAGKVPPRGGDFGDVGSVYDNDNGNDGMRENDIGILNRQQLAFAKKQQLMNRLHGGDRFDERQIRAAQAAAAANADDTSEELANLRGMVRRGLYLY